MGITFLKTLPRTCLFSCFIFFLLMYTKVFAPLQRLYFPLQRMNFVEFAYDVTKSLLLKAFTVQLLNTIWNNTTLVHKCRLQPNLLHLLLCMYLIMPRKRKEDEGRSKTKILFDKVLVLTCQDTTRFLPTRHYSSLHYQVCLASEMQFPPTAVLSHAYRMLRPDQIQQSLKPN